MTEAIIFLFEVFFWVALPFLLIYLFTYLKRRKKEDHILKFLNRVDNTGEWVKFEGAYMRRKG